MTDRLSSKLNAEPGVDRREFIGGVAAATVLAAATRCAVASVAPASANANPQAVVTNAATSRRMRIPVEIKLYAAVFSLIELTGIAASAIDSKAKSRGLSDHGSLL